MPNLDTSLHLDMLRRGRRNRSLIIRIARAVSREFRKPGLYGIEWGDPEQVPPLAYFLRRFVIPYINDDQTALEIGAGGGRWTQYLTGFAKLYAVDYHQELLDELARSFPQITRIRNNGADFPGVPPRSVDYLFSFGVFVHLDASIIEAYLENMRAILAPSANVVLQYGDKTKVMGAENEGFSDNDPERMCAMIRSAGYVIVDEDRTSLWHSAAVRFQRPR